MSTLITKLLSSGILYTPAYFDEVTYTTNKLAPNAVYSYLFDEYHGFTDLKYDGTSSLFVNLKAFYNFSGNANDSSSGSINLNGVYQQCSGKIGNGAQFSGYDGLYYNTDIWNIYANTAQSYTVSFWYNPQQSNDMFMAGAAFSAMGIAIQQAGGKVISYIPTAGYTSTQVLYSNTSMVLGRWYHIVVVVDQGIKQHFLYINNKLEAYSSFAINWPLSTPTAYNNYYGFAIGGSATQSSSEYGGKCYIDLFGLWGKALTKDEIGYLYNANKGIEYPNFPTKIPAILRQTKNGSLIINGYFQEVDLSITAIPTPTPTPTPTWTPPPMPTPTQA